MVNDMFDPNEHKEQCETYMSRSLGFPVDFVQARKLTQSSRQAPWRLDVRADGDLLSFVLQLDARGMENEYRILKAMESISIPTPHVFGLDLSGEALGTACFFSEFIFGESLLQPMLNGEAWAEALYFDAVTSLQAITKADLGEAADSVDTVTMDDVLEDTVCSL